jgi:hypothetical protein
MMEVATALAWTKKTMAIYLVVEVALVTFEYGWKR